MRLFLSLILGCSTPEEPELILYQQAIAEYDQGTLAMDGGDLPAAIAAFERAQAFRPEDLLIGAWRAKALADSNELEAAITELSRVIAARPSFTEARYNRAAYLARLGRFDESAVDVRKLLGSEAYLASDLYEDPDFSVAVGDASFAFVPKAAVSAELVLPEHSVVQGTEVPVRLRLKSTTRLTGLKVEGSVTGPAHLTRVLEERAEGSVTVTWSLRMVGAGPVSVGPFLIQATGANELQIPEKRFEAWTPPNRVGEEPRTLELELPSTRVGERRPSDAWRESDSVYVLVSEGHKVEINPSVAVDAVVYERRLNGVADWVLLQYAASDEKKLRIEVRHRGQTVFEGLR